MAASDPLTRPIFARPRWTARSAERRPGGGETKDVDFVVELTGQTPPRACQTGEAHWRAYKLTQLP